MGLNAGNTYWGGFTTQNPATGEATDADFLPVGTATKNGVDDAGFPLTVANIDTGRYSVTGTVPSTYVPGDFVQISIAATLGGVSGKAVIDSFLVEGVTVGNGSVEVDHDYGGTDELRLVDSGGLGVDGAKIRAYLKTDWDANRRGDAYVKGRSETDVNGRWLTPIWLDPATYTLAFSITGNNYSETTEVPVT